MIVFIVGALDCAPLQRKRKTIILFLQMKNCLLVFVATVSFFFSVTLCVNSNQASETFEEYHDYVDLGLPSGILWATCNVGAINPEDYGSYFAWGETQTKTTYTCDTYKHANGDYNKLTKYCSKANYGDNGFTDNLTTLQAGDDAATAKWGSGWRTPSKAQWEELKNNTNHQWMTKNGVNGLLFTSKKNGQTLFLPAAGFRWDNELYDAGSFGLYQSRSLYTVTPDYAWHADFGSDGCDMSSSGRRDYGFSVRPVREK